MDSHSVVLVLEQDPSVATLVVDVLAELGFVAVIATTVIDALSVLEALRVELIVWDIATPAAHEQDMLARVSALGDAFPLLAISPRDRGDGMVRPIRAGGLEGQIRLILGNSSD
jgi:DNA-binding response OmpR family regulator